MNRKLAPPSAPPPQTALSRWDGEGGAGSDGPQTEQSAVGQEFAAAKASHAELDLLHARVIALENLVLSLLAQSTGPQLEQAREMAARISPHADATQHPLTIAAAARMIDLVARARHFQGGKTS